MKRLIIAAIAICAAMASCDIHIPSNGQLDGFWQLTGVDTLATGAHASTKECRVFWAVQGDLMRATSDSVNVLFRFVHIHDSLTLFDPYIDDRYSMDIAVTSPQRLAPLGIHRLRETYAVEQLDDHAMVLQSDLLRLYFRKY